MIKNIKIPEERIGVLKACIKKIGKKTGTDILVDNENVKIDGKALDVWKTKDIIKAIGRGFNPEKALELLDEKNNLCIINIKDYYRTEKGLKRVKSRLIGSEGKTKNWQRR